MRFLHWNMGAGALLVAAVLAAGPGSEGERHILGAAPGPCNSSGTSSKVCPPVQGKTCAQTFTFCKAPISGVQNVIICTDGAGNAACVGFPGCTNPQNANVVSFCTKNTPP